MKKILLLPSTIIFLFLINGCNLEYTDNNLGGCGGSSLTIYEPVGCDVCSAFQIDISLTSSEGVTGLQYPASNYNSTTWGSTLCIPEDAIYSFTGVHCLRQTAYGLQIDYNADPGFFVPSSTQNGGFDLYFTAGCAN